MQSLGWRTVIALGAACLSMAVAVAEEERRIQIGETVIAEMPPGDTETTSATYEFVSRHKGRMTIKARSLDFDAGLRMWSDTGPPEAHFVFEDDNSGLGTDSRIVIEQLVRKQRYHIEVRPVTDDWGGTFELSVQEGEDPKLPLWEQAGVTDEYWEAVEMRARQRSNAGRGIRALRGKAEAMNLDDPDRAVLMNRAVTLAQEFYGAEALSTVPNLDGLALAYEIQGEFGAARPLRERALEIRENRLGAEHPQTEGSRRLVAEFGTVRAGSAEISFPKLIPTTKALPKYPERARKLGVTGRVIIEAIVRRDGTVGAADVLQVPARGSGFVDSVIVVASGWGGEVGAARVLQLPTSGVGFVEAAMDSVQQWRYEPAMKDGEPVDVYMTVVVEFDLRRSKSRPDRE